MLTRENIVPSDLHYALTDLSRLMDNVRDTLSDLDFVRQDGTRIHELDTISSLVNIGGERLEQLADACLRFDKMNFDRPSDDELSAPIRAALHDYAEKEAIFRPLVNKAGDTDDCEAEWKAKEEAENVLIRTPCVTLADVRAKAELAIKDENVFDSITNCRVADEHVGITFLKSILNAETGR